MEPDMPDNFAHTLTTFLKCVANVHTETSKSNFDLRGLDRKCRCAAKMVMRCDNGSFPVDLEHNQAAKLPYRNWPKKMTVQT